MSLVLLAAAAVTLVFGIQGEGIGLMIASAVGSALAAVSVVVGVVRRVRRR